MKKIFRAITHCVLATLLSACGVQIQMETLKPAAIDLGRGAALSVRDCVGSPTSRGLADALRRQIAQDGFYAQYPSNTRVELCNVYIENPPPPPHRHRGHKAKDEHKHKDKKKHDSRPTPYLHAVVVVMQGGQQIYRRDYKDMIWVDSEGHMQLRDACDEFASEIMDDLTPRQVTYFEYITPDETNPALEQAARACSVGNWSQGKVLAENALRHNPQCAEAYYLLGLIARNDREFRSSDDYFYRANSLSANSKYSAALRDNARMQQNEARAGWQMGR